MGLFPYFIDRNIVQKLVRDYFHENYRDMNISAAVHLLSRGRLEIVLKLPQKIEEEDFFAKVQKEICSKLATHCGYQKDIILTLLMEG